MSERWGFDLSMEAVRLMRYRLGEWHEVGVQKLEDDNIEARLAELVAKVKTPASVDIFLPRDQILFTDVKVDGDTPTTEEIFSAMDGRTPYDLADLEIDWVSTEPGLARVAAIATQTLDEAEAFVAKGGLTVRAFSSLASPDDFPRAPVFVEREAAPEETPDASDDDEQVAATPAFATARSTQPPLVLEVPKETAPSDTAPVVKVDDPTPVLQLPETDLPPLNPGTPLPRPTSQPRVVTNVGASAAAARAASLTATPSIAIRQHDRAVPTPALAGIAAALSIGIAIIIWAILPSTPETSLVSPEAAEAIPEASAEIADAAPAVTEESVEVSPLPTDIADVSNTPTEPALAESAFTLGWNLVNPRPLGATVETLESAQTFAADPRPTLSWLEPRPTALAAADRYVPVAPALAITVLSDAPDFAAVALSGPVAKADIVAGLTLPPTNVVGARPTVEIEAPAAFVENAVADAVEEAKPSETPELTELAALNPVVEDLPAELSTEPVGLDIAEPDVTEPDPVDPDPIEVAAPPEPEAPVLVQTALAAALPSTPPSRRPDAFTVEIERQKFGGRTRDELAEIRPGTRPQSAQLEALVARAGSPPSDLAVNTSVTPRGKPNDFDAIVAAGLIQLRQEREARTLAALTPDTSGAIQAALADEVAAEQATRPQNSPRLAIPSNASVARQATIEEAMRLNRINLVGVFGRPTDRRALVRLSSGRYIKVKVGDKVDGGTVAAISDTALQYQKGGRTVSLSLPQG